MDDNLYVINKRDIALLNIIHVYIVNEEKYLELNQGIYRPFAQNMTCIIMIH